MARPRPPNVVNERDLPWIAYGQGRYVREVKRLGPSVATVELGLRLERVQPGRRDVPLHWHLAEEEGFIAVEGAGLLVQTDADGAQETSVPFSAGEAVLFPADRRVAHRFDVSAEADGPLTFLTFGDRAAVDLAGYAGRNAWLVRRGTQNAAGARKDGLGMFATQPIDYYEGLPDKDAPPEAGGSPREATLPSRFGVRDPGTPPSYSPVVRIDDVAPRRFGTGRYARDCVQLSPHLGAERFDLHVDLIPPGHADSPLHFHLGDEELFYILQGEGVLRMRAQGAAEDVEATVSTGDCISFPAATGTAHQILVPEDAEEPLRMLTLATRAPVDVVRMVDSKKWILKRSDLPKEAQRDWGSAILKDQRVGWLDDEPLAEV